jgi:hypothetical protein
MSKIYTIFILLIIIEIPTVNVNMRFFFLSVYLILDDARLRILLVENTNTTKRTYMYNQADVINSYCLLSKGITYKGFQTQFLSIDMFYIRNNLS